MQNITDSTAMYINCFEGWGIYNIISGITTISSVLLFIALIISITTIVYYKKFKPFIVTIIMIIIIMLENKIMDLLGIDDYYYTRSIVSFTVSVLTGLIPFTYSIIKLVKYRKSDKFGKENKDVRDD